MSVIPIIAGRRNCVHNPIARKLSDALELSDELDLASSSSIEAFEIAYPKDVDGKK